MYEIKFYEDKNGRSEVYEYIEMLSKNGLNLSEPFLKKIDKEIWELRPLRNRILFAILYNNKFILVRIFRKKTQKTPKREIEKAKKFLEDYKREVNKNEKI